MGVDQNSLLSIAHPDVENKGTCTQEQFDEVWESLGWKIVDDNDSAKAPNVSSTGPTGAPSTPAGPSASAEPAEPAKGGKA